MPKLSNNLQYKGIWGSKEYYKQAHLLYFLLRLNVLNYNKHLKTKTSLHKKKNALSS